MKPKRAVIPLAGLASRLQPATKVIPKALLPVPGRDGSLRPAVDWIVREALTSGVDEVILIVSPRDGDLIRRYFQEPPTGKLEGIAGRRILHAWSELEEISKHLHYVHQLEPGGFGDAVLQASEAVGSDPFVLLLGDHLYRSRSTVPCLRQVLDIGAEHNLGVLGISRCYKSDLSQRGVVGVRSLPYNQRIFELFDMREKPTVDEASDLCIPGMEPPQYFCLFGIYLLPSHFMEYLNAASLQQHQGELDLSSALRSWIWRDGGLAYEVDGEFLDIGTPTNFRSTVARFSEPESP